MLGEISVYSVLLLPTYGWVPRGPAVYAEPTRAHFPALFRRNDSHPGRAEHLIRHGIAGLDKRLNSLSGRFSRGTIHERFVVFRIKFVTNRTEAAPP